MLLVTANKNETKELLDDEDFVYDIKQSDDPNDPMFYNIGTYGCYNVIHLELNTQGGIGADASSLAIVTAINNYNIYAVIIVGVAFGKEFSNSHNSTQKIGDILISNKVVDYESGKIRDEIMESDGVIAESGRQLLAVFKQFSNSWSYLINGKKVNCEFGMILSGDKVVDDREFKEKLLKRYPRAIGGEMEGRGAYSACRNRGISEWIIVKSICDWADGTKGINKEENQIIAAKSVVSLLNYVFGQANVFNKILKQNSDDLNMNSDIKKITEVELKYILQNSVWLPDAEFANSKQAEFSTFMETSLVDLFVNKDEIWGLSAVKGVGKTYVLQNKRRKSSLEEKNLCLPIGLIPCAENQWGTETVDLKNINNYSLLNSKEKITLAWKYSILCYVINQVINYKTYSKEGNVKENYLEKELKDLIITRVDNFTYDLCTSDIYTDLSRVMMTVLNNTEWFYIAKKNYQNLQLTYAKILRFLESIKKERIVIHIDKIDQAIKMTPAEIPNRCEECDKRDVSEKCTNKMKAPQNCIKKECNSNCCYGCELYDSEYFIPGLRMFGKKGKKYEHVSLWQYIQIGLLKAAADIKEEFKGIIVIYFVIRQEAFSIEDNLLGEHSKKIMNFTKELYYTKNEQKDIFYKYISKQDERLLYNAAQKDKNPELAFVGIDKLCHPFVKDCYETVFDSIYRHSFDRARDMQEFGKAITEQINEIKNAKDDSDRAEIVKNCIENKAAELAFYQGDDEKKRKECYYNEKMVMLPNFWVDNDNFKKFICKLYKNLYLGKEIAEICRKYNNIASCDYNCSECIANHYPFSVLYYLGMIGYVKKNRNNNGEYKQTFIHSKNVTYIRKSEVMNINEKSIYLLHPALTKSIEHMEKNVMHFNRFIIGKGLKVSAEIYEEIIREYDIMELDLFEKKYFGYLNDN